MIYGRMLERKYNMPYKCSNCNQSHATEELCNMEREYPVSLNIRITDNEEIKLARRAKEIIDNHREIYMLGVKAILKDNH